MEKMQQPDSITTVTIKPEYAPSEIYSSSEAPPAYHRSQSASVQVAKIVAVTIVLMSVVIGSFLLASAYVTANASCRHLEQELQLLSDAADRFQGPLQPEALIQEAPKPRKHQVAEPLKSEESKQQDIKEINNNIADVSDSDSTSDNDSDSEDDEKTVHFKLPLQLDFDDLAGALIEKNQRSRMNCVVEKKRSEQVVDHQPKTVNLPFGLNLTTDPRFERVSGERMAIFCESGNVQRNGKPQEEEHNNNEVDDDDEEQDTIMIQPVMIPIPSTHFQTHMAQQMQPIPQSMPHEAIIRAHMIPQTIPPQPQRIAVPLHPMETMRPPMPPMMQAQSNELPPNQILHQIAQQIIAQKIMEAQKANEEQSQQQQQNQEFRQVPEMNSDEHQIRFPIPEGMVAQRIPIPESVLSQLNRLPNRDVIVAVAEQQDDDEEPEQQLRIVQQQRQNPQEMNGRQVYARGLSPVNIPVPMMQQEQEPEAQGTEETRPHYVQPRSVRSVDALLEKSQKRVKRCSCDCAC